MFNLINELPAEDKQKIEKYISLYGTKHNFIGLDAWLTDWAKNKIKLYKLLGNSFIYKIPYQYEKDEKELDKQMCSLIQNDDFISEFRAWVGNHYHEYEDFTGNEAQALLDIAHRNALVRDKIPFAFKYRREGAAREIQLQAGMKPMRAFSKILDYFKNEKEIQDLFPKYEKFRLKHSMILNDKIVKGNLVISIHPLDFMTMSDNASDWQSCMSWRDNGCYHVGTIEMMNSNNVVCCYLESKEPFYFNMKRKNDEKDESCIWANKKWRQLCYITKDIIVSGKPYPYPNIDLSKFIISTLRGLAKDNLHWFYSFGPERYLDMKHINSAQSMDRVRRFIQRKDTFKHNIIFDTKGMYNDMLNDNGTEYWCVRNKVDHNKIISYSGKAPCLCCGAPIIRRDWDSDNYYNERYTNTGSAICEDCMERNFNCNSCGTQSPTLTYYSYEDRDGNVEKICEECWNRKVFKCPCCGKPMVVDGDWVIPSVFVAVKDKITPAEVKRRYFSWDYREGRLETLENNFLTMKPIFVCSDCEDYLNLQSETWVEECGGWCGKVTHHFKVIPYEEGNITKYQHMFYPNLEKTPAPTSVDEVVQLHSLCRGNGDD